MDYKIRPYEKEDGKTVIDIFNYFVENSFAAYPQEKIGYEYVMRWEEMTKGYPFYVIEYPGKGIVGFAFLRSYHHSSAFKKTAEITYFILPDYIRMGIGKKILDLLLEEGKKLGIKKILASISSLNDISINFHFKNGFYKVGQFKSIGEKWNSDFDIVWMQKDLD